MYPILLKTASFKLYSYPVLLGLSLALFIFYIWENTKTDINRPFLHFGLMGLLSFVFAKALFWLSLPAHLKDMAAFVSFYYGGGYVFYGGLFGLLLAVYLSQKLSLIKKISWQDYVPAICLAHSVGRIGCFLAGCCHGKMIMQWGTYFPVQIVEAVLLFILFIVFHNLKKRNIEQVSYLIYYLASYSIIRFFLELLRGDEIRGIYRRLSTSQWVSIGLIVISFLWWSRTRKHET